MNQFKKLFVIASIPILVVITIPQAHAGFWKKLWAVVTTPYTAMVAVPEVVVRAIAGEKNPGENLLIRQAWRDGDEDVLKNISDEAGTIIAKNPVLTWVVVGGALIALSFALGPASWALVIKLNGLIVASSQALALPLTVTMLGIDVFVPGFVIGGGVAVYGIISDKDYEIYVGGASPLDTEKGKLNPEDMPREHKQKEKDGDQDPKDSSKEPQSRDGDGDEYEPDFPKEKDLRSINQIPTAIPMKGVKLPNGEEMREVRGVLTPFEKEEFDRCPDKFELPITESITPQGLLMSTYNTKDISEDNVKFLTKGCYSCAIDEKSMKPIIGKTVNEGQFGNTRKVDLTTFNFICTKNKVEVYDPLKPEIDLIAIREKELSKLIKDNPSSLNKEPFYFLPQNVNPNIKFFNDSPKKESEPDYRICSKCGNRNPKSTVICTNKDCESNMDIVDGNKKGKEIDPEPVKLSSKEQALLNSKKLSPYGRKIFYGIKKLKTDVRVKDKQIYEKLYKVIDDYKVAYTKFQAMDPKNTAERDLQDLARAIFEEGILKIEDWVDELRTTGFLCESGSEAEQLLQILDGLVDSVPLKQVAIPKKTFEAVFGYNFITGKDLTKEERWSAGFDVIRWNKKFSFLNGSQDLVHYLKKKVNERKQTLAVLRLLNRPHKEIMYVLIPRTVVDKTLKTSKNIFTKAFAPKDIELTKKYKTTLDNGEVVNLNNYERMKIGKSAIYHDGKSMEAHHVTQKEPSTMVALPYTIHKSKDHQELLHTHVSKGESFRNVNKLKNQAIQFKKIFWKSIAEEYRKEYLKKGIKL